MRAPAALCRLTDAVLLAAFRLLAYALYSPRQQQQPSKPRRLWPSARDTFLLAWSCALKPFHIVAPYYVRVVLVTFCWPVVLLGVGLAFVSTAVYTRRAAIRSSGRRAGLALLRFLAVAAEVACRPILILVPHTPLPLLFSVASAVGRGARFFLCHRAGNTICLAAAIGVILSPHELLRPVGTASAGVARPAVPRRSACAAPVAQGNGQDRAPSQQPPQHEYVCEPGWIGKECGQPSRTDAWLTRCGMRHLAPLLIAGGVTAEALAGGTLVDARKLLSTVRIPADDAVRLWGHVQLLMAPPRA